MSVLDLIKDILAHGDSSEFSPDSPTVSPVTIRTNRGFSPLSPLSPVEVGEMHNNLATVTEKITLVPWLKPCSICGGHLFNESERGGFFCAVCQELPVDAKVNRQIEGRPAARATGYGCGRCGNIEYMETCDGWVCAGCGAVYLVIGGSRGPIQLH